jgi:hypothetical protein
MSFLRQFLILHIVQKSPDTAQDNFLTFPVAGMVDDSHRRIFRVMTFELLEELRIIQMHGEEDHGALRCH